jgi:hypothetical protein
VAGAAVETTERLFGPEEMERLRRLAPRLTVRTAQQACQRRFEGVRLFGPGAHTLAHVVRLHRKRPVVGFLTDVREHELVTMTRHGTDEPGLARVVAQGPPQAAHGLAQSAIGDDDVAPYAVHQIAPVDGFVTALNQEDQQIEVARDERHLPARSEQRAPRRRHGELREPIARHA